MWPLFEQVRDRKARQAASSLRQPMLHSAYSEAPQWTPTRLIRIVIITFLSGVIAGMVLLTRVSHFNMRKHCVIFMLNLDWGSTCRYCVGLPAFDGFCMGSTLQSNEYVMSL